MKKFVSKSFWVFLAATLMLIVACSGETEYGKDETVTEEEVKQTHVALAYAMYLDSLVAAQELRAAVTTFIADPTEDNLALARSAYKALRPVYQQSETMRWDTDITIDSDTGDEGIASVDEWEGQVNAWPLDESFIDYISTDANAGIINDPGSFPTIDKDLLISENGNGGEANVTTGIHAIEFLLWGQDLNGTGAGAGERPASDYDTGSCSVGNCDRRGDYLKAVTDLLVEDLTNMVAEWSPDAAITQGTLAYNFLNSNLAIDYMLLAMRSMATDELASARMGSGLTLLDPEEEHDCFSDLSHVAIYYNFQGVKNAFYGSYGFISGPSFADLIRQKNYSTFEAMDNALSNIETQMKQILDLGEQEIDPVRFDQIIGEGSLLPVGDNYELAVAASDDLVALETLFDQFEELLSLVELTGGGSGD